MSESPEDKAQRIENEVDQLAYVVSHDLREPLTAIAGFATLFKRRYEDTLDEQGKRFIEQIIDGTRRMEQKVDDLLDFSRAGRLTSCQKFPLGAAIEEAKKNLVACIQRTDADIQVIGEMPEVWGSRSLIAQVFQNLFSNSIKYRGIDKPHIEVKAERSSEHRHWLISVRDYGIGFDMQYKDRIFAIFQRLYTVEQYPGTGIGLAIAKRIVERHHGTIWVESEPDKGATFFFTLPDHDEENPSC